MAKITQHTEGFRVNLEADETFEIKVNGDPKKTWTVSASSIANIVIKYHEELQETPE